MVADTVRGFESLAGTVGSFAPYALHGVAPSGLQASLRRAEALEASDLDALAAKHLAVPGGVLVLVGDAATIRAQWKAQQVAYGGKALPEPVVIDREAALAGRLPR